MILYVKCAFLYGNAKRDIYIELPPEDPQSNSGNSMGELLEAMYGTRDAPLKWQEMVQQKNGKFGIRSKCASSCCVLP